MENYHKIPTFVFMEKHLFLEKYGKLSLNYHEILTFVFVEKHLFLWRNMENYL